MPVDKMADTNHPALKHLLDVCNDSDLLQQYRDEVEYLSSSIFDLNNIDEMVTAYESAIRLVEKEIRKAYPEDAAIKLYQQLFQELETLITRKNDNRHKFVVVIPVADRPRHLQTCLQSILTLCQAYHFGGYKNGHFSKVVVVIADDTREPANIRKHKEIARHFEAEGLETVYFGLEEQQQQLDRLTDTDKKQLTGILGDVTGSVPSHKGPSIMRNITYLKLNDMRKTNEKLLFHFIDSDQEFQVKTYADGEGRNLYAINYFHELDKIFSQSDISILTGKVVGDPPVSPAVMAGTFLDDIITFLHRMATTEAGCTCQFHTQNQHKAYDAAYHDMAELFGFKPTTEAYDYQCTLSEKHDHAACFARFAAKLNQFFHGEHPTRKSYFNYEVPVSETVPARTIYTGNYVFNTAQLKYFIPFARLKLRMAGPVLGRIVKAENKNRFVSANLPMLHNRTVEDSGKSEFRPGINSNQNNIDLSGEFERQYFGDVMLFSMEQLTTMGYPEHSLSEQAIVQILESTEKDIRQKYATKQLQIQEKLQLLKSIFLDSDNWWYTSKGMAPARENFRLFITNIEQNFDNASRCYELIDSDLNRDKRFKQMFEAIIEYPANREAWKSILGLQ